jgi:hypothetical protein
MLHDFGQVAAVDQVAADRAILEVIGLTGRRPSVRPAGFSGGGVAVGLRIGRCTVQCPALGVLSSKMSTT